MQQDICLYYALLSSFQHALCSVGSFQRIIISFLHSIYHIYTILQLYLSKFYSIAIYLAHCTNIFDFLYTKNFKIS